MATADDFLLLVLVLPVELGLEAKPVAEETIICPEICKKRVTNEPHFTTVYAQGCEEWHTINTYAGERRVGSSSPPRTAVSC